MYSQSTQLTNDGTVLKESDDIVILGVTSDSKMTFEKHLRRVFRVASQRLDIFRKSWRVFHHRVFLGRCFRFFSCPFWSTVLQCGAQLLIHTFKLLDCAVSGVRFLTGVVLSVTLLIIDLWHYQRIITGI